MPLSEAQKKANSKWRASKAQIAFRLDPEFKKEIDDHVTARGERLNDFIKRAIVEQIKRDNGKTE